MSAKKTPTIDLTSGVDDEPEPTVTLANADVLATDEPSLPGFEMTDDEEELPPAVPVMRSYVEATNERAKGSRLPVADDGSSARTGISPGSDGNASAATTQAPAEAPALSGDILTPQPRIPTQGVVYESRIRVLEAWQYPGRVPPDAPAFVDRNWIGWAGYDAVRQKDESPCLRVPVTGQAWTVTICRPGDFVVRQEVQLGPGLPSDIKIEVWEEEQFARLFMPVRAEKDGTTSTLPPTPEPTFAAV